MAGQAYTIGAFLLDPDRQLSCGERPVALGGKALRILSVLAAANGRLVTKDELMAAVWPDVVVEENAIHVHVAAARRALGADAAKLATVWGRGYRLDGAPCALPAAPPSRGGEAARLVAQARAFAGRVTPGALLRAIDLHERAIARDPGLAAAWTGLAGTLMVATVAGVLPPVRRATARAMAEQAIRIDTASGAPLAIRAVLDTGECRWEEAADDFATAAARSPDEATVHEAAAVNLWASIGHLGRAAALVETALRHESTSANVALSRAWIATLAGDHAAATTQLETATLLGVDPNRLMARLVGTELAIAAGDAGQAAAHIAALLALVPVLAAEADADAAAIGTALVAGTPSPGTGAMLRRLADAVGRGVATEHGQVVLGQLIGWQARLGALDAAFAAAGQLVDEQARAGHLVTRAIHPWWHPDLHAFRADPRFTPLAARLGLPEAWRRLGDPDHRRPAGGATPGR